MSDNVFFATNHPQRVSAQYDRSLLKLGAVVYVVLKDNGQGQLFSPTNMSGSVAHTVVWIAPSEWFVKLAPKWVPDDQLCQRITELVSPQLDLATVRCQLNIAANDIRLIHQYKTSEYRSSRLQVVTAVADRLDLVRRLQNPAVGEALFAHWEPLCVYLLLTCFDLLGQPAHWMPFDNWLAASRMTSGRQDAISTIPDGADPVAISTHIYKAYGDIYGVRNSFYHFLDHVLPQEAKRTLLDSMVILRNNNPPEMAEPERLGNADKKKYLFTVRNSYTHRSQYVPGIHSAMIPPLPQSGHRIYEQWYEANTWSTVLTKDWPTVLLETVRTGLANYLEALK